MLIDHWGFSGPLKPDDKTNYANKLNMVKIPNWRMADQLAIY